MRKVELLAPAKNLASGITAIDCGADAVYIGGPGFGARHAASNSVEDIARLVDYARPFGAGVYATLNTLVYEDELRDAETIAREAISAGVDALIVQDMSYLRMGLPPVRFHASTQMCNTSPERVRFLGESGFSRVVLERGLTLEEIKRIREATDTELECFIHGAICVGFSGQCYLSRSMGPRSGNRGDCAQPCRMPYDLVNGAGEVLIGGKHLLSVRDLDLSSRIGELIDAGIDSFKIEGRLKDEVYVKTVVSNYRRKIDAALEARAETVRSSSGRSISDFDPDPSKTFARGGTVWMLCGKKGGVANFDTPKATGEYIGRVVSLKEDWFGLDGDKKLSSGDGICFFSGGELQGTNINRVENGGVYPNRMQGLSKGMEIYRNYDHAFAAEAGRSIARRVIDVSANLKVASTGISLTLRDKSGTSAGMALEKDFGAAQNPEKMRDTIKAQLSKTGSTIFNVEDIGIELEKGAVMPFIPVSALNELRRGATAKLREALMEKHRAGKRATELPAENPAYPYPCERLGGEANVTNSLARKFYEDHGVMEIAQGFDLFDTFDNVRVMTSAYCLLRELGKCPKQNRGAERFGKGGLYLERGKLRYRLEFDCGRCMMNLVKMKS